MEWDEFILSTLRPYSADWIIEGGWGEVAYLIRIDGDCSTRLVLAQNGGVHVEGDEEPDDVGGSQGIPENAWGEGLPDSGDGVGDEPPDDDEEESARYGRNERLPQVNRRLNPLPVRWR